MSDQNNNKNNENAEDDEDAFTAMDSGDDDDEQEEDYYALMNVSRDATDKDLTRAYHRLGLIYHPDKQKDFESKRASENMFIRIKKAYDGNKN